MKHNKDLDEIRMRDAGDDEEQALKISARGSADAEDDEEEEVTPDL